MQKEVVVLTSFNTPFQQVSKDTMYVRFMLEKKVLLLRARRVRSGRVGLSRARGRG